MRFWSGLIIGGLICFSLSAQRPVCGHERYIQKHGRPADVTANAENSLVATQSISIPVVVHVVYRGSQENLTDERILSQLAVLNEDFSRSHADTSLTPAAFKPVAGHPQLQFCLAHTDPDGQPTTGILRIPTAVNGFSIDLDDVKQTALGGHDPWPANRYLNLWVCALEDDLLGYATLPGFDPSLDGVVIDYRYFGRNLGALAPFNLGRTATHEVGHWLNLEHIWGDDNNNCSGTDFVSDTPDQAQETYDCPSFPLTDGCSPAFPGIQFMNFMDYTNDGCMNLFTQGQVQRMQQAIQVQRAALLTQTCGALSHEGLTMAGPQLFPQPAVSSMMVQSTGLTQLELFDLYGRNIPIQVEYLTDGARFSPVTPIFGPAILTLTHSQGKVIRQKVLWTP
jgi:Pregnancy-associated plasma protein-A